MPMPAASGAMAAAEMKATPAKQGGFGTRLVTGALLAVGAIAAIWAGGLAFNALIALCMMIVLHEWAQMHKLGTGQLWAGMAVLATVCGLAHLAMFAEAAMLLGAGALLAGAVAIIRRKGFGTLGIGLLYAGLPALSLIWLRAHPHGLALVMWTMALVWATDIFAYFSGRAIGGPKIWPALSPNKTWAGLIGGMKAAAIFSGLFAWSLGWPAHPLLYALAGAGLAFMAQAGDFFESALKRRAGVKDSGTILPGHGGVMDRVDGLVPVAVIVALMVATGTFWAGVAG